MPAGGVNDSDERRSYLSWHGVRSEPPFPLMRTITKEANRCPHCARVMRLEEGICFGCLLREGLQSQGQASAEAFETVLAEAEVPDSHWHLGNYEILEEIGTRRHGCDLSRAATALPPHCRAQTCARLPGRLPRDAREVPARSGSSGETRSSEHPARFTKSVRARTACRFSA